MALSAEWRDQITSIIVETERNLGLKATRGLKPAAAPLPRPAPAAFALRPASPAAVPPAVTPVFPPAPVIPPPLDLTSSLPAASSFPADQRLQERTLESVRFELDLRGSMVDKQLEVVRDEMKASADSTHKAFAEKGKMIEDNVKASIESEGKLRNLLGTNLDRLREVCTTAHKQQIEFVQDLQQTAIDHSSVLKRLDTDLTTFRKSMETRYAEQGRKLEEALEGRVGPPRSEGGGGGGGGGSGGVRLSDAQEARLAEVEAALLQERDLRKAVEGQLVELREKGGPMSEAVEGAIEVAVATAIDRSGTASSVGSLDEKVKECGRLIVRMVSGRAQPAFHAHASPRARGRQA